MVSHETAAQLAKSCFPQQSGSNMELPYAKNEEKENYDAECMLDACRQIVAQLQPYRTKLASLAEVTLKVYKDRVNLSMHRFYAPDDSQVRFDFAIEKPKDFPADAPENSWKGHPFNYFTQGVIHQK